ncbi:MAG: DUF2330 domain-containing protein [Deltaproteobacteria bacterium]|nr:DUF2330 domain-containing protein [Deltaproteobacteria bacterium]
MRNLIAGCTLLAGLAWTSLALPCGGGFGMGIAINPDQTIVVSHKNGIETYQFSPHFCGSAAQFGLILPVPGMLSGDPVLGDPKAASEFEAYTKPSEETNEICMSGDGAMGGAAPGGGPGTRGPIDDGVNVVSKGQVGMFTWQLLKADTAAAFTDWLDANKFPYSPYAKAEFDYYVTQSWYFVAFTVTADAQAPTSGAKICGDLGPLKVSFPTATAVIPSRIANATSPGSTSYFNWRIFFVGSQPMTPAGTSQGTSYASSGGQMFFKGIVSDADLGAHPAMASMAASGDWVTWFDYRFRPGELSSDLAIDQPQAASPYRHHIVHTVEKDCSGLCSFRRTRNPAAIGLAAAGLIALLALARRRKG